MPRTTIDYSNTIIYKIVCNDPNITDLYVGHTTNFTNRKYRHRDNSINDSRKASHCKVYTTIRENGGWYNWSMIEIEKFSCVDENEAKARERYWIETLNCSLNSYIPLRTSKEYWESHKQRKKELDAKYRQLNKATLKEKKGKLCVCDICGVNYTHAHQSRHYKSQFHLNHIKK
jgi:uncharacterized protein with ParB-like and HNH nuclease domain